MDDNLSLYVLQVQILQDVLATGYTVDMLVAPDRVSLVENALRRAKIPVQIADTNVQRSVILFVLTSEQS